ncbi:MAG: thermonuclease family protein [Clostridia bacterium]|nr:thermonuclease family protein [Clostridia bacterium]
MKNRLLAPIAAIIIILGGLVYTNFDFTQFNPVKNIQTSEVVPEAPVKLLETKSEGMAPHKYINALVTKVVDGDTIHIEYKKKKYKVRLLAVDTPESVEQGVAVQPYSKEAAQFLKNSVLNREVRLVFEKGIKDRYGRLLAHVIADGKKHINSMLVRNGFARVEIISPNKTFSDYLYRLQEDAIKERKGMWSLPEDQQPFIRSSGHKYVPREKKK